ncbi:MAG: response regulator transcription factor [Acidobacteriaceae bacterium]
MEMDSVLVVEDSLAMQKALRRIFEADAMTVRVAGDGITALEYFRERTPSAVVLDLKVPGRPGKDLCRAFKSLVPQVPIVVVSANSAVEDKVLLLELGADDYVTKPFSPKELLARVRRAMRRSDEQEQAPPQTPPDPGDHVIVRFSDVRVNFTAMEVSKSGRPVTMTAQEFKVLRYLTQSPGKVISREELLNGAWGYQCYPTTRTVDNHILRLRQKLEQDPANPVHLLTMIGVGYKFVSAPTGPQER